jgi:hypothetical protein
VPRTRSLNPKLPDDEDLAECSIPARYVFALLPTLADREGRLPNEEPSASCMLEDGHAGDHEWTPDGDITLVFQGEAG